MQTTGIRWILAAGLLVAGPARGEELPVARIGAHQLSAAEFAQRAQRMLRQGYSDLKVLDQEAKAKLLEGMISQDLLILEGLACGIDQQPEIAAEVQRTEQRVLIDSLYARQALVGPYTTTEAEERRYFTEHRYDVEFLSQQIVCATEAEAHEALAALKAGEPFAALVPRYSTRRVQQRFGPEGEIGWYKLPDMLEELQEPMLQMKEGSLCEQPIKTELGYHAFLLKERREVPFEQVRELMGRLVVEQKRAKDRNRYVEELRRQYALKADDQALARLHALPADQKQWPGPDVALYTWKTGQLTAAAYMDRHQRGKARHPSSYDLAGLYQAVENLAGQQIMMTEARRLGYDQDPVLRGQIESRRNELIAQELYRREGRAANPVGEAQEREYYQANIARFTQASGEVTPFAQVQKSIHTLLTQREQSASMDRFLASLKVKYRDQLEIHPERLAGIEIQP